MFPSLEAASILAEALPYIQAFSGQTFVIKYGGSAMTNAERVRGVLQNVLLLQKVGVRLVLVHGGGPEIDRWLEKVGIVKKVIDGLRVTDADTMEVVEMVLSGSANKGLVSEIQRLGGKAVGLSGRDSGLLTGEPISEELGRVGRILRVNPDILEVVTKNGYIPVVATVAEDFEGKPLNINADTAASAIAGALGASKLILLTDTNGVLSDKKDAKSTISKLHESEAQLMIKNGRADRGMIPKLQAACDALEEGVESVHLINGATPNVLILETLTENGAGTMITR